jgi:hypothetical protein
MGKCPLYGKCTIDATLLDSVGAEDKASQKYKYEHIMCKGEGTPPDQWLNCVKYDPDEAINCSGTSGKSKKRRTAAVLLAVVTIITTILFYFGVHSKSGSPESEIIAFCFLYPITFLFLFFSYRRWIRIAALIAGIILIVGIGMDTNIVVIERIREELGTGKQGPRG